MSTPALRYDSDEKQLYQFACPNCWVVRTVTLAAGSKRPMCECGSALSVIAEVESEETWSMSLDHLHTEPSCSFCAARQAPMQHRLWCAIYSLRPCNCGCGVPG